MKSPFYVVLVFSFFISPAAWSYTSGQGTEAEPYEIANLNDLLELAETTDDYSSYFILTADIDMTSAGSFQKAVIAPDTSSSNYFQGSAFNGVFDGNGHIIRNLIIDPNEGNDYLGLFGYAGYYPNSAQITDLGVEAIIINSGTGHASVGALVGEMYNGQIKRCFSTGSISLGANSEKIGGLIGYSTSGDISNSYSRCSVSCGENSQKIAGLLGGCYGIDLENNYSAGLVTTGTASSDVGGFLGVNDNISTMLANFWDIDASGQENGVIATELRSFQMFSKAPYLEAGWDFINETDNGNNDYWKSPTKSYPILSWQDYTIGTADLIAFADNWLTDSLDPNVVYPVDFWQDSRIDMKDFSMLAKSWLGNQMHIQFGEIFDGFETGDFSALDWDGNGTTPWVLTDVDAYEGTYCAVIQAVPPMEASELTLNIISGPGKIGFYYKNSGSRNIYFYIDDNLVGSLGPNTNWTYAEYDIIEGDHTCRWLFYQFLGGSVDDVARLDNVRIYSPD